LNLVMSMLNRHDDRGHAQRRATRCEHVVMATVILAGAIGLTRLVFYVTNPGRDFATDGRPGENDIVRCELINILIPAAFHELANGPGECATPESYEALRRCLKGRGLEKAWYMLVFRRLQVDGKVETATRCGRPFENAGQFPEFQAVLAAIAGNPPSSPLADFSTAQVSIIPERFLKVEPTIDTITELLALSERSAAEQAR
jgi:hypothetical protein